MHPPSPAASSAEALRAGIGLRQPHYAEGIESAPPLGFVEVHSEHFFAALCERSGCGMLLDVNNIMVNALNEGVADPLAHCKRYIDALPQGIVGEIHLAGYCETDQIVIDDHGSRVRPDVWALYDHV